MKAVIPAAGMGTRFLPATKAQAKEMLPVLNKPVIQYVVEEAVAADVDEVVVVNSRQKKSIEDHFSPNEALATELRTAGKDAYADAVEAAGRLPVSYVYQDEPLGLGHAIRCAAQKTAGEPFYVLLGDVIVPEGGILQRMLAIHEQHGGANVIAVFPVPDEQVSRFGIIAGSKIDGSAGDGLECRDAAQGTTRVWKIDALVEKPTPAEAPSNLAVFGRYLLSPRVMELLGEAVPTVGGEIQLTGALDAVLAEEEMYAVVVGSEEGYDTGTVETWLDANVRLADKLGLRL
jgi:UTP--glucose-1-phosphate uridylyltransferase